MIAAAIPASCRSAPRNRSAEAATEVVPPSTDAAGADRHVARYNDRGRSGPRPDGERSPSAAQPTRIRGWLP